MCKEHVSDGSMGISEAPDETLERSTGSGVGYRGRRIKFD